MNTIYSGNDAFIATEALEAAAGADERSAIVSLYHEILLREASEAEIQYYLDLREAGVALSTIEASFWASEEATTLHELTLPVVAFYQSLLVRVPEPGGLDYWSDMIDAGEATFNDLIAGFTATPEFRATNPDFEGTTAELVTLFYRNLLDREPDSAGLAYWVDLIDGGTLTPQQFAAYFMGTDEFEAVAGARLREYLADIADGSLDDTAGSLLIDDPDPAPNPNPNPGGGGGGGGNPGQPNAAPTAVVLSNVVTSTPEDGSAVKIADVSVTDDGRGTNTFTLVGADAAMFELRANNTELWFKGGADFESGKTNYNVTVQVADATVAGSAPVTASTTLGITDVIETIPNAAPTAVTLTNTVQSTPENGVAVKIAGISITDDGQGSNTVTLVGDDAAMFELRENNTELWFQGGADFESGKTSYDVTVQVADATVAGSLPVTASTTLGITDVVETVPNEAPTEVTLSNVVVSTPENGAAVKIADISIVDDGQGTNTFTLVGIDAEKFEFRGGNTELWFKGGADFESGKTSYDVTVQVADATVVGSAPVTVSTSLGITDVVETIPNAAPTAVTLTNVVASTPENGAAVKIAGISITDDGQGTNTVTLVGADAAMFELRANDTEVWFKGGADFESGTTSYDVTVQVADTSVAGSVPVTTTTTLAITDVVETPANQAPTAVTLTAVANAIPVENVNYSANPLKVADIVVTDPDTLGTNTLALLGQDSAAFRIEGNSLYFIGTANFEVKPTYSVQVTVDDATVGTVGAVDATSTPFNLAVKDIPGGGLPFTSLTIQAEDGVPTILDTDANTNDTTVRDPSNPESTNAALAPSYLRPGFTGTGYVDFGDTAGDKFTYTIEVDQAGSYDLNVRYASNGARPLTLVVNGGTPSNLPFASTGTSTSGPTEGFNNWMFQKATVQLVAGTNTFSLAIPAGATTGPNLDRIDITPVSNTAPTAVTLTSVNASVVENVDYSATGIKVATIALTDDGKGSHVYGLTGADAASFQIVGTDLFFKGKADFEAKNAYKVAVTVDDTTIGAAGSIEATSAEFTLPIVNDPADDAPVVVPPFTIQAEDATKVTVQDTSTNPNPNSDATFTRVVGPGQPDTGGLIRPGAVGGAYMDFGGNAGDAITITTDVPVAGKYAVTFRYANGGTADRPLALTLNNAASGTVSFVPGPTTGTGADATAWNSWVESTVELNLIAGTNMIKLAIPTGASVGPNIDQISFVHQPTGTVPFNPLTLQAENWIVYDTVGTTGAALTQKRDATNPETNLARDTNGDGLWDNHTGTGYMDMGGNIGDAAGFMFEAPTAGTYTLTFRYANGSNPQENRAMTVIVDGISKEQPLAFPGTTTGGWDNWQEVSVKVDLAAGTHDIRLANTIANGPNLDRVVITRDTVPTNPGSEPGNVFEVKVNFQPAGVATPAGYVADTGLKFGDSSVTIGGKVYQYGWVTEASITDGTPGTTPVQIAGRIGGVAMNDRTDEIAGLDSRMGTYAHLNHPSYTQGANPAGNAGWEMELDNGFYEVTVSIGDTAGPYDSYNVLRAEGQLFNDPFTPVRPAGAPAAPSNLNLDTVGFRSDLVTKIVQVTDGRLTLDAVGLNSNNTEIQYLEIKALPDLTPADANTAPSDYAQFINPRAIGGSGGTIREVDLDAAGPAVNVDPASDIVLGISVAEGRGGALLASLKDGSIKLVETVTGKAVAFSANTTAGFDSVTITPTVDLKPFTSYSLVIDGFQDLGNNTNPAAPTRDFQKFSTTFVTGEAAAVTPKAVAFAQTEVANGALYTSVELSPDGSKLYVGSLSGEITRWDVDASGNLSNQQVLRLDYFGTGDNARGIIGLTFDPTDPDVLWVTDNHNVPLSGTRTNVPDFSGRVSKVTIGDGAQFTATATTYVTGLPRSVGDHVTNSLEFRVNPDAGVAGQPSHLLYVVQGSNTAMGAPDGAWGLRPERLLNAAVLEIDPSKTPPAGGFDVSTEPVPADNLRFADNDGNLKNGGILITSGTYNGKYLHFDANGVASVRDSAAAGSNLVKEFYDPFEDGAVVKIFATGTRNAYDLVWHSNGYLYVPTNGSAAGGNTPDNPTTSGVNEARNSVGIQDDYLFRVSEGKYYGHPNTLRNEYILNGGNPTANADPNQVGEYAVGIGPDPDYVAADAMSLGRNRSPNGAIEYMSDVFGGNLQHNILFTEYSSGNGVRSITLDANGRRIGDDVLRDSAGRPLDWVDPLDLIENTATGQIYVLTLDRSNGQSKIIKLDPRPGGAVDPTDPTDPTGPLTSIMTIQAEDNTPNDGTSVFVPTTGGAQIVIRTDANRETGTGAGYVNGLRPGAFGLDGNTVNTDGVPGGYADFGSTNADYITFTVTLTAAQAGDAVLRVRYANGDTASRPLDVVVNNVSVGAAPFSPPATPGSADPWTVWQTVDVPAKLVAGTNTITFRSTINTGPNIDQLEILKGSAPAGQYDFYEAEAAQLVGAKIIPETQTDRGAEGTGFVDFDGTTDQSITWINVDATGAGTYELAFRYALVAGKGDRPLQLTVNGQAAGSVNFDDLSSTDSDWKWATVNVTLREGANTIKVTAPNAVGPDIDQLRVLKEPVDTFTPTYASIGTEGRIELENGLTARVLNEKTADFFFKVATTGLYALDFASNAGAPDGGDLALTLNGAAFDTVDYPFGAGEKTTYVQLTAGVEYNLRAVSTANGANVLDYLDVRTAPVNANADIVLQSMDPTFFDDRLHFSYLEDPDAVNPSGTDRAFKSSGSVTVSNTGSATLNILDWDLSGPFKLAAGQAIPTSIGAGQSITVKIDFDRAAYQAPTQNSASGNFSGALRLVTNDAEDPVVTVDLAGFWQARDEGGWEPNINEVWEVFGFGNRIEGLSTLGGGENSVLSDRDVYRSLDADEVLAGTWRIADGLNEAKLTQIAAYHGPNGANLGIHNPGNKGNGNTAYVTSHSATNNQSILPVKGDGSFLTSTITKGGIPDGWTGSAFGGSAANDFFGIISDGLSTDPRLNGSGGEAVAANLANHERGYTVRMYQARDAEGNILANTYLGVMDYTGINYDYNDNMFVIEGVTPVFGQQAGQWASNATYTPWTVGTTGRVLNALSYDAGAQGVSFSDSSGGVDTAGGGGAIGSIANGEWVEYTINVQQAGSYNLSFLASSNNGNAKGITATFSHNNMKLAAPAYETSGSVAIGNTGNFGTFVEVNGGTVDLEAGVQTLRLTMSGGNFDLRSIEFEWLGAQGMAAFAAEDGMPQIAQFPNEQDSYTIA